MADDDLTFTILRTDGCLAVLGVGGEIDMHTAPILRERALDVIAQGHPHLIFDLAEITFCDSSGLNALIGILRCAKVANGSLTLAAAPDRLLRILKLTGLSNALPSYPSTDDAMKAHLNTAPGLT